MKFLLVSLLSSAALSSAWAEEHGPLPLLPTPAHSAPSAMQSPEARPLRTTTDTREYCAELSVRVDDMARSAKADNLEQVRSLSQEGERLCKDGHTRSGILHLRRAYILARPPSPAQ